MDENNQNQKKKVFIKTNSGRNYTGIVIKEDEFFLYIIDKYNLEVRISLRDIEVIEEVQE
jgi:hypothetical protein